MSVSVVGKRWSAAVMAAGVLVARGAWAQDSQAELARRDLIARAEEARRAGRHAEALESATRAGQIRGTPSLRLLLAQEHDALGHTLEALEQARACVREAEADATLRNRELVMSGCQAIATASEPRVGRLVVRIEGDAPSGLHVRVGEREMNAALVGVPYPVMPGRVSVRAEAEGYRAWEGSAEVRAGAEGEVLVRMARAPEAARVGDGAGAGGAGAGGAGATPHPVGEGREERSGPGAGPWVLMGVGAAGVVAGGVFALLAYSAKGDRDTAPGCSTNSSTGDLECNTTDQLTVAVNANNRRELFQTSATITLSVGGAAILGGVLWHVLGSSRQDRGRSSGNISLGTDMSSILVVGAF